MNSEKLRWLPAAAIIVKADIENTVIVWALLESPEKLDLILQCGYNPTKAPLVTQGELSRSD